MFAQKLPIIHGSARGRERGKSAAPAEKRAPEGKRKRGALAKRGGRKQAVKKPADLRGLENRDAPVCAVECQKPAAQRPGRRTAAESCRYFCEAEESTITGSVTPSFMLDSSAVISALKLSVDRVAPATVATSFKSPFSRYWLVISA